MFISFEGIDKCGKSTQMSRIRDALAAKGFSVLVVREPGGTALSERIRDILLDKVNMEMTSETEILLFEAARAQIVREVIKPALEDGKIVLCDRFFDSTMAYQGYARGLPKETVEYLNQFATGGLVPDITFILDLPVETAWARWGEKDAKDRLELQGLAFMQKVRDGYLAIAKTRNNIAVLDAGVSEEILAQSIKNKLREVMDI